MQRDNNSCFSARQILQKRLRSEKLNLNKMYQVDTSRKAKVETNTIRIFSSWLETSTKSYDAYKKCFLGNAHFLPNFDRFCQFWPWQLRSWIFPFIPSCAAYLELLKTKFFKTLKKIIMIKFSKNLENGPIFRLKIDFFQFWPWQLSQILSGPC